MHRRCLLGGAPSAILKASPATDSTADGALVASTGTGLTGATRIAFGSEPGTNVSLSSDAQSSEVAPAGASTVSAEARSRYVAPPKVTRLSTATGSTNGGSTVTISGSNFVDVSEVMFGASAGTDVKVVSERSLTVTSPIHDPGTVDVTVVGAYGTSIASSKARFVYISPPTITSLSPAQGPVTGGTKITVTGSDFTKVAQVLFGTKPGTGLKVKNSTSLTVVAPAETSGIVDVRVITAYGISPTTEGDHFTYGTATPPAPATPTITSIDPISGSTSGGNTVAITGTNLTGATKVTIGGLDATNLSVASDSRVTAVAPPHTAGLVDIQLTAPGGTTTKNGGYTYAAPVPPAPTITSISPVTGPTTGGNTITITGTNLTGTNQVTIDGTDTTNLTVVNDTTVTATAPPHNAGIVNLVLIAPGGATNAAEYTYFDDTCEQ